MIYIVSNQTTLYDDFEGIGYSNVEFCTQYFKDKKFIFLENKRRVKMINK